MGQEEKNWHGGAVDPLKTYPPYMGYRLTTFGRRAFSVAGPTANSLPDSLRDPAISSSSFRQQQKTGLLQPLLSTFSAVEMLHDSAL